ncbi:hypothetical protein, partial [Xenorhabdus bovienii]|uniref:hypothetical protein n=2 Tax=Xenorhabdus TaxID=626 RepID=UPI0023B23E17
GQLYSNTPSVKITTNETNPTHLMPQKLPQKYDNIEFVAVKSDENGKISFRVYAVKDTPVRVDFTIQILRVTYARFVASLYVFNDKPAPVFGISSPFILGLQPGGT